MSSEIHDIMHTLKEKTKSRLRDNFFGSKANSSLKYLDLGNKEKFILEATTVYSRATDHLKKWYNFEASPFQNFTVINLKNEDLVHQDFINAAIFAKVQMDEDNLYNELNLLSKTVQRLKALDMPIDRKWVKMFASCDEFKEVPKLVAKILSIPISNAYVERIFSILGNTWTDGRNLTRVELVKSELCTKFNFDMTCADFLDFLNKSEQVELFKSVSKNKSIRGNKSCF
jgi:hypothetical protein